MEDSSAPSSFHVDLHPQSHDFPAYRALMHRAFAVYTEKGNPSGALLETAQSLRAEVEAGLGIGVIRAGSQLCALVKFMALPNGTLYFSRLSVDPEFQGRGLARRLVAALRAHAASCNLDGLSCAVRADERGNIALYEHLGMQITQRTNKTSLTGKTIPVVYMADQV